MTDEKKSLKSKESQAGRKITRRGVLNGLAATGAAFAGSGAIGGFPTIWAQNIKDVELIHVGGAWSAIGDIAAQASADLGFTITMQNAWSDAQINRVLTQPESLDIVDMEYWTLKRTVPNGALRGVDIDRIPDWDRLVPIFTKGVYWDESEVSQQGVAPFKAMYMNDEFSTEISDTQTKWATNLPIVFNADTLGSRPDIVGEIDSWAKLLDPELAGRTAMIGVPAVGIMDAAMAIEGAGLITYGDKGNMTIEEIDKTIEILIEAKRAGQFRAFWNTFDESVNLMTSGEVVLQSMWQPAVQVVRARGVDCRYVSLREGYRAWGNGLGFMRHLDGLKLDAAYEYLNWFISGYQGAFQARNGYYTSLPETARPLLEAYEWDYWYEGLPAAQDIKDNGGNVVASAGEVRDGGSFKERMGNIACWNTLMDENRHLVSRWNEFISI